MLAGRYRLAEELGRGARGVVWRGVDERIGRPVAVRVLPPAYGEPQAYERLAAEARALGRLRDRRVAELWDYGQAADGTVYVVTELVDGHTLAHAAAGGPAEVAWVLGWAWQVCQALEVTHAAGLVHRGIRPTNVMLADGGAVKLLDTGIAWAVHDAGRRLRPVPEGGATGVQAYMAPEQLTAPAAAPTIDTTTTTAPAAVDGRADLYALGCVLHRLLTGALPAHGAADRRVLPPPPSTLRAGLPGEVDALVLALLDPDPARRPNDATAAADRVTDAWRAWTRDCDRGLFAAAPRTGAAKAPAPGCLPALERLDTLAGQLRKHPIWDRRMPQVRELRHLVEDLAQLPGGPLHRADLGGLPLDGAQLSGVDLADADLTDVSLTHADLTRASLTGAILHNACLHFADLSDANLAEAHLTCTALPRAILREANLAGAKLNEAYLYCADLSGAHLGGARLPDADLTCANLAGADLRGAYMYRANLNEANLHEADLAHTYLHHAKLSRASLRKADLSGADLSEATLYDANLDRANLTGATLTGADLSDATLYEATLHDVELTRATLTKANLLGARLTRANLAEARLDRADLCRANLADANLTEADLSGTDLCQANLTRANLTDARMTDARMSSADLTGATLCRANLYDADLLSAQLSGADLNGADLSRADLRLANMSEADLTGVNLYRADLTGAQLNGADLSGADLRLADLTRADLTGAHLTGADLTGVRWSQETQWPTGVTCPEGPLPQSGDAGRPS
ncbi:serine/threonine-protein kinase [Streptomyces avidinii]|uniref:serine/threonine-protein kinase n=1 Tax=Streptomyces avidinii TaxID=1895 RepID=UPI00386D0E45|nr:serine/threonine-protein kinase [Streptomyces avidinii]